eukprot:1718376-Pyramimonas_sp.AAC.1
MSGRRRGLRSKKKRGRTSYGATNGVNKDLKQSGRRHAARATRSFGGAPFGATSRVNKELGWTTRPVLQRPSVELQMGPRTLRG